MATILSNGTVLSNATLVTGDQGRTILYDSALAVRDTVIAAIGPAQEIEAQFPDAEILDCRGKAVFPGLVNCHTHLLATADRGILEDFGFPTTLGFPESTRSMLTTEERQVIATLGALEAIRSGTTTLLEIADHVGEFAESLADTGMRLVLADNFNDVTRPACGRAPLNLRRAGARKDCAERRPGRSVARQE